MVPRRTCSFSIAYCSIRRPRPTRKWYLTLSILARLNELGDDRDIWCKDCEYHRDHEIHLRQEATPETGQVACDAFRAHWLTPDACYRCGFLRVAHKGGAPALQLAEIEALNFKSAFAHERAKCEQLTRDVEALKSHHLRELRQAFSDGVDVSRSYGDNAYHLWGAQLERNFQNTLRRINAGEFNVQPATPVQQTPATEGEGLKAENARLRGEKEHFRVQVEERYGAVAQWQSEAETNRQAWLKLQQEHERLRSVLQAIANGDIQFPRESARDELRMVRAVFTPPAQPETRGSDVE